MFPCGLNIIFVVYNKWAKPWISYGSETVISVAGTQRKNVNILLLDWLFWTEPLGGQWGKYRQGGQQVSSTLLCTITLFPYLQQPVKILLRKFTFSLKTTVSVVVVKYG